MLARFTIIKQKQLLRKFFITVSLHLLYSKNWMQHRQCEGSDRNLCLCKIPSPFSLDSCTDDEEEPNRNSERKISEKQDGGKQLGKLENELMCEKKRSLWMSHKMLYRTEVSCVSLKINISPFFSGCFWFSLIYLRFNQNCINAAICSHIHRQCHPNKLMEIWEHRDTLSPALFTGWNGGWNSMAADIRHYSHWTPLWLCFCGMPLDLRISLATERFPFYAEKKVRVLSF